MSAESDTLGKAARRGFWITCSVAALCLMGAFFNPVAGLVLFAIFAGLAFGIRRKKAWAAIAALCILTVPVIFGVFRLTQTALLPFAISSAVQLVLAAFIFAAARELWRDPSASRAVTPWVHIMCLFAVFTLCFWPYQMPSGSMEQTLLPGDQFLVEKASWHLGREPQRDQLVTYRYPVDPRQTFVKRIAGVPGDHIKIVNKQLLRNGAAVSEPWTIHSTTYIDSFRDNFPSEPSTQLPAPGTEMLRSNVENGEVVVPPGKYFVLGDNRDNSLDSRYTGFISRSDIVGAPLVIYASYNLRGVAAGDSLTSVLNLRWNRLFKVL
jgi:signal peptidase I